MSSKLQFQCPICGSAEVFYSCEPKCCYNHVCADCKATFEPITKAAKPASVRRIEAPDPLPDPSDPAVACARCESIAVYVDADGAVVCKDCGTVLEIEMTEVTA